MGGQSPTAHAPAIGLIEDEQCQKIGRGYKAVRFRFLLFLWMEPIYPR
jgi:hypothetical protein